MQAFLEKFSFENNKQINIDVWFPSNTYSILELSGACKKIKTALCDIFQHYDSFVKRGSGWVLKKVLQFSITIMKYKLFQGGCLSTLLPPSLQSKRCCVSIRNAPKGACFQYCVVAGLCAQGKNKYRRNKTYDKIIKMLPCKFLTSSISLRDIKYFKKKLFCFH